MEKKKKIQISLTFLATLCPKCGWTLNGQRDSVVLTCSNCETAWEASEGTNPSSSLCRMRTGWRSSSARATTSRRSNGIGEPVRVNAVPHSDPRASIASRVSEMFRRALKDEFDYFDAEIADAPGWLLDFISGSDIGLRASI